MANGGVRDPARSASTRRDRHRPRQGLPRQQPQRRRSTPARPGIAERLGRRHPRRRRHGARLRTTPTRAATTRSTSRSTTRRGTRPTTSWSSLPPGYFPTSATALAASTLPGRARSSTGHNFGVAAYQVITLNAEPRAESRQRGPDREGLERQPDRERARRHRPDPRRRRRRHRQRLGLVQPLQQHAAVRSRPRPTPRIAPQSVLAIAVDTLDTTAPSKRVPTSSPAPRTRPTGNFFVWFNQNSGGNDGYLPTTYSPGCNYRTTDTGDVSGVTADCRRRAIARHHRRHQVADSRAAAPSRSGRATTPTTPTFTRQRDLSARGRDPGQRASAR